jgi:aconitase A
VVAPRSRTDYRPTGYIQLFEFPIAGSACSISGLEGGDAKSATVTATPDDGGPTVTFQAKVRVDTPQEVLYLKHGGILQYVLRQMAKG